MKKIWKDVPNYEDRYMISNYGELKSFLKTKTKILKGVISNEGYVQYRLSYKKKDLKNTYGAHQIVAMAFLNHTPNGTKGYVVDHIDDNKLNNRLDNIQLFSNSENSSKRFKADCKFGAYKNRGKFTSIVWHKGKNVYLGYFEKEEDAHLKALEYIKNNKIERITN